MTPSRFYASHQGRRSVKWLHYLEIYERHFNRFVGQPVHLMEIGVAQGGSLQMWRQYLGGEAEVIGVDCDEACRSLNEPGVTIETGQQGDRGFLRELRERHPRIDILIDDGSHRMEDQITTFEEMFWHLSENGVYLCEDLHTSYWEEFGGGHGRPGTFIEFSKALIDQLNAWHSRSGSAHPVTPFTRAAWSMHYYDSVLVIEKRGRVAPVIAACGG